MSHETRNQNTGRWVHHILNYCKETGKWKHAPQWKHNLDNAACPAGSTFRHVVPRKREVSGSAGATLCVMYPTKSRLQPDVNRSTPQVLASVY